jgi:hypothetical protein
MQKIHATEIQTVAFIFGANISAHSILRVHQAVKNIPFGNKSVLSKVMPS